MVVKLFVFCEIRACSSLFAESPQRTSPKQGRLGEWRERLCECRDAREIRANDDPLLRGSLLDGIRELGEAHEVAEDVRQDWREDATCPEEEESGVEAK